MTYPRRTIRGQKKYVAKMKWTFMLLVFMILLLGGYKIGNAQTVTMTASVHWNNCNIETSVMPFPEIIQTYENEYGTNFIARIGSSTLFAIRTAPDVMNFYLDEAEWSIINGVYIAPKCEKI